MKKYAIKATALAIGALVGGAAVASVDFTPTPFVATTDSFASEISYAKTGGTTISGAKVLTTKLGFGVSSGQTRFIRVNLTNAVIGATPAAGSNVVDSTSAFSNSIVAQGGQADDSYVIYQVTGQANGHGAGDTVVITLPDLFVTNANAADVTVSYALYADPVSAANQTAGTSLSSQSGSLFGFSSGIKFKVTTKTQTATVADSYKKFSGSYGPVDVGSIQYAASGAFKATGVAAALTDIVGATTKVKVLGDFNFTRADNTATNLRLGAAGDCANGAVAFTTIASDLLSASFTAGNTPFTKSLCITNDTVTNTTPVAIPAQTFSVDFNPVSVGAGVSVTDPSAVTLGATDRDGTTLTAPFVTIHPDYLSRVVLTSTYGVDVPLTATVVAENGATCTGNAYATTLKKNSQLVIDVKSICPALSTGATRLSVTVSAAAPRSAVNGVYNVMNYDVVTGKTNSLISYVMVVPGTN
nr:hypothetical protein [uncultured Roseateles sp.]